MDINGGTGYGGGGGGLRRRAVGPTDFYRHVPKEMTEATKVGVVMSLLSILLMIVLFISETYAFASTKIASTIEVDPNAQQLIRMNFNITLYDLHCDFVSLDVWDSLGTNLQNVTKDITKWNLDMHGQKKKFAGRNANVRPVQHEEHSAETMQDLSDSSSGGQGSAVDLDPDGLVEFLKTYEEQAFIDFYAPWCIWCQRLTPTWEKFAREIKSQDMNLGVGTVDCVANPQMCKDQRIMAFPTLRWYENGQAVSPDYRGDRTVDALMEYVKKRGKHMEKKKKEEQGIFDKHDSNEFAEFEEEHHPGCLVAGHLMVNRVPGNFHMEAQSVNHAINSAMTNLTHRVNSLSFGSTDPASGHLLQILDYFSNIPEKFKHTNPMKDKFYPTYEFHEAWHHHMKIVSTHIDYLFNKRNTVLYQILENSQVVYYPEESIPEIKFRFDMSPMSVNLSKDERKWYEYVTSLCAIIGGTYTTLGLINATLLKIFKPKKI